MADDNTNSANSLTEVYMAGAPIRVPSAGEGDFIPPPNWFVATNATGNVLQLVAEERTRQDRKWGVQTHPDMRVYISILTEEVGEAAQAANDYEYDLKSGDSLAGEAANKVLEQLRIECVQVAAVAVKIVEAIDRKRAGQS